MRKFPIPCVECHKLTKLDSARCEMHNAQYEQMKEFRRRQVKKATGQYSGDYKARAKLIRETAIFCHLCGGEARPNDKFEADHLIPGDPDSPLLPAHASCNRKRGNKPL